MSPFNKNNISHRPRLLASTAALTLLFGGFAAPAMAMQPAINDVVAVQSTYLAISDNNNQQQQQQQEASMAAAAKPSALRLIDADIQLS